MLISVDTWATKTEVKFSGPGQIWDLGQEIDSYFGETAPFTGSFIYDTSADPYYYYQDPSTDYSSANYPLSSYKVNYGGYEFVVDDPKFLVGTGDFSLLDEYVALGDAHASGLPEKKGVRYDI